MTRRTVLFEAHKALEADMVDFSGYEMPVRYKDSSIIDEHLAVRNAVGMFDVSHMGRYWVTGPDAKSFLDLLVPRNIMALSPGKAGYTFMLNEAGGFRDDVIISQLQEEEFMVVCNAGNREKIWNWMVSFLLVWKTAGKQVEMEDKSDISSMIALQGPQAKQILQEFTDAELPDTRFRVIWTTLLGHKVLVSTTGYTGEAGYELILFSDKDTLAEKSIQLWDALKEKGVKPCALGARDTLRLEAGYCLYGNDIDETINLLESSLDFKPFATLDKTPGFIGQAAVLAKKDHVEKVRVGFKLLGRGIARHNYKVYLNEEEIGFVASGTQSPLTKESIGMAYVPPSLKSVGSKFQINVSASKMRLIDAEVVPFPTYDTSKYGGTRTS